MPEVSRRDFMKLALTGAATVAARRYISLKPTETDLEPTKGSDVFRLDREITDLEIESCKKMFARISLGVKDMKGGSDALTYDEGSLVQDFDNVVFSENTDNYVEALVRLQKLHHKFTKNSDIASEVKSQAIHLIETGFNKLALPLNFFLRINEKSDTLTDKELAYKFLFETANLEGEVHTDPLIGKQVYSAIGMQTWYQDFDIKYVDGKAVGVYPFTQKLLKGSGGLFKDLITSVVPLSEKGTVPENRPERFRFGSSKGTEEYAEGDYKLVPVSSKVKKEIIKELEKCGIGHAASSLAFRENKQSPGTGGFADVLNLEASLLIPLDRLDMKYFTEHKSVIIHAIKHEFFHILVGKIKDLNDFDAYLTIAQLNLLYRQTCCMYGVEPVPTQGNLRLNEDDDIFDLMNNALENMNEAFRNRYITDLAGYDSTDLETDVLGMYTSDLRPKSKFWSSALLDTDFEKEVDYKNMSLAEKIKFARQKVEWAVNNVEYVYSQSKDSMTYLERFVSEEIIRLSEKGGIFSEFIFCSFGAETNFYVNSYLPSLMVYLSVVRGDKRFEKAFLRDVDMQLAGGIITEDKAKYLKCKLGLHINKAKEVNQIPLIGNTDASEHLADQFAFALTDYLGYDFRNPISSAKSHLVIDSMKPEFHNLLSLFKARNLAYAPPLAV